MGRAGWFIKRFVRTGCHYRAIEARAGQQILTADDPVPPDLREAVALVK